MKTVMYGLSQPINTLATRESLFKPEDFGWDLWEPICGHLLVVGWFRKMLKGSPGGTFNFEPQKVVPQSTCKRVYSTLFATIDSKSETIMSKFQANVSVFRDFLQYYAELTSNDAYYSILGMEQGCYEKSSHGRA